MVYFSNRAINRLYAHSALQGFAENAGNAFAFVYFLHAGFSVAAVLATLSGLLILRLTMRQLVVPFAKAFGIRAGLIVGTVIVAGSYLALAFVETADWRLALYLVVAAFGEAFYWTCFHAAMASLGDAHVRGAQASAIQLLYALTSVAGPLVGGLALTFAGPQAAFLFAGLVQALATLPLLYLPRMPAAAHSRLDPVAARTATWAYFSDGISSSSNAFEWSLALFITLGEKFQTYGLAQAGAALCGAAMALLLGKLIDAGHPKRSAMIGLGGITLALMLKAVSFDRPWLALLALAVGAIAGPVYNAAYNARIYNLAKASGDALRFHVRGEGGWDLGTATASLAGAAMIHFGLSFFWVIGLGLIGVVGVGIVIRASYQNAEPSLRV
jgi:DHA1 family inner membrane transport protein